LGLTSKRKVKFEGEKPRQTKMEKKMQRMQREWREEERRRKEAREEESDEEFDGDRGGVVGAGTVGTKKGKKRRQGDFVDEGDDDWAAITSKRTFSTTASITNTPVSSFGIKGLVGLHDVVLAPPKLVRVREKMKAPGGVGPGTGGLKRQGELSEARARIVDGYRALMKERRGAGVS
jgi:hypothetical protein